jgi:hypothetical protein
MGMPTKPLWIAWGVSAVGLSIYLGFELERGEDRSVFLPGATSDGHHQIELACEGCHGEAFAGRDQMQEKCEGCHLEALDEARDSHPKSKFTDPRNADRTALLDARYCVTCHVEHRPARTHAMGLTIAEDYCVLCHGQIADERPTHEALGFETCASSGCHNFHDNRSIYEDFLLRHAAAPALTRSPVLPARNFASIAALLDGYPADRFPIVALDIDDADAPAAVHDGAATRGAIAGAARGTAEGLLSDWAATAHAASGVNCTACHAPGGDWADDPGYAVCGSCHARESARFVEGRHGMRLDAARLGRALPPMTPADARLPMRADPIADRLDCGSCHGAHRFDTQHAAVEACLGCHDDAHSRAYVGTPHHTLVERARAGELEPEAAVTCASCHMPRTNQSYEWGAYVHVLVEHNQSDTMRPNEKMIRSTCLTCHGLGFSLDALADRDLIERNFDGRPSVHVASIDFALERRRAVDEDRQRAAKGDER